MRTKYALLNGVTGLISQFIVIILGFISRAVFIRYLGEEYLGLTGTFTNILSILSVTELGLGSAITYCLYKPIFEDEHDKIAGIMNLFKQVYFVIGFIILAGSLIVTPFIQFFLKDYTMDLNYIRMIFMLYSFNSVITYFLGYPRTFLFASQQNYIVLLTDFIAKFLLIVSQILVLIYTQNYVAYLLLVTISNTATNIVIRRIYHRKFPYLKDNKTRIDTETRSRILNTVKYLSISTLISVGVFGTDNLIISSILGVTIVGFYSNYSMIIQQINLLFTSLLNGVVAGLGNMIAEGDRVKINNIFNIYDFAYYLVASFTAVSLYILFNVFIADIWLDGSYLLGMHIVAIIVLNSYLTFKRQPIWQYQNVAGIFREFLPYSIMELLINLSVSIILAFRIGLIGVFLGTTSAYLCSWIGQIYVVHKHVLYKNHFRYYLKQLLYLGITVLEIVLVTLLDHAFVITNVWVHFAYLLLLCAIVPNGVNVLLFSRTDEFAYLKDKVLSKVLRRDNKGE